MQVVLVHGIWDNSRVFRKMAAALSEAGHTCYTPDLVPANGAHGLVDLAHKLKAHIDCHFEKNVRFALVGFSMGAIVSRIYLQDMGGASRTTRFFTISGPHHGTATAYLWPGRAPGEMRFNSPLLQHLNTDPSSLSDLCPESYRTPFDLLILPSSTSHVTWARNHLVYAPLHHLMIRNHEVIAHIVKELKQPPTHHH